MTLRESGQKLLNTGDTFLRDLELIQTASPLDWPLYMVLIVIILGFSSILIAIIIWGYVGKIWWRNWRTHFEADGTPLTSLGSTVKWCLHILSQVGILIIVWLVAFLLVGGGMMLALEQPETPGAQSIWSLIVLFFPTMFAAGIMYLAYLGRKASIEGRSKS